MRRRSFFKSIMGNAAFLSFLGIRNDSVAGELPKSPVSDHPRFTLRHGKNFEPHLDIDGIGCGINDIDEVTNGFFGGQLVGVHGPMEQVNIAFLFTVAVSKALSRKVFVDYVASQSNVHEYYRKIFGVLRPENRKGIDFSLLQNRYPDASGRELLRVTTLDLGDLNTSAWKNYKEQLAASPPGILILDGVEYLETFCGENSMADELKQIANTYNIPVLVHGPTRRGRAEFLRHDFSELCDVDIRFLPKYECDYFQQGVFERKYVALNTRVYGTSCPCKRHSRYSAEMMLQFENHWLQFQGSGRSV